MRQNAETGREKKVGSLMHEILDKLQLLHTNEYFHAAVQSADLKAAIDQLSEVESSLPDNSAKSVATYGSGAINVNTGSGKQYNNNLSGDDAQQTNTYN